jgi:hypothetical protein
MDREGNGKRRRGMDREGKGRKRREEKVNEEKARTGKRMKSVKL